MNKRRIVEKRINGTWSRCQMKELREGDVFRMFDTKHVKCVGDSNYAATSAPRLGINPKYPNVWGIRADPHKN